MENTQQKNVGEMTLIEHLAELRFRLRRILLILLIGLLVCWGFSDKLMDLIRAPIQPYLVNGGLVFTNPIDKFMSHIKIAFIAGCAVSAPLWLFQLWQFISPALYKNEKKYVGGFILFGTFQFSLGLLFCYYIVFPMAFKFLMTFGGTTDTPMITIDNYLDFFFRTALLFALTFQMPVIISFIGSVGLISKKFLQDKRKYAVVGMSILAAIVAPPDALSMILLLVPLWVMYEISVILVGFFENKKLKKQTEF